MTIRDCCKDSMFVCQLCYPRKETSIHYAQIAGRFVYCQCLKDELLRYPGPAGIKGVRSEYLLLNCHYRNLVSLPCDYDYVGKPLEEMPCGVSIEVCEGYAKQDVLIMEEEQAMTFADTDYFYSKAQLHTIQTQKFPLFNLNGVIIGTVFIINDFFPAAPNLMRMPDFANLTKPLSMTETRLVYCKRIGLSDKDTAIKLGVSTSTVRSLKARVRDKTRLTLEQLKQLLSADINKKLINKKDSFRIK